MAVIARLCIREHVCVNTCLFVCVCVCESRQILKDFLQALSEAKHSKRS